MAKLIIKFPRIATYIFLVASALIWLGIEYFINYSWFDSSGLAYLLIVVIFAGIGLIINWVYAKHHGKK